MSKLRILDHHGDTTLQWDVKDKDSVAEVKAKFDNIISHGYMAFSITSPVGGEVIRKFDPNAEEIIMTAPLVGG